LFPQDVRLQFKLAQIYDGLGTFDKLFYDKAEAIYTSAMQADPNLAEIYARYGVHLFKRRKLLRSQLYYQKAMSFPGGNEVAEAGLNDIEVVRLHAHDPKFVEQFGNPLNDFDMESPTEEDEKRCGTLHD
jgi:Tfp pilus assembly protein PilF